MEKHISISGTIKVSSTGGVKSIIGDRWVGTEHLLINKEPQRALFSSEIKDIFDTHLNRSRWCGYRIVSYRWGRWIREQLGMGKVDSATVFLYNMKEDHDVGKFCVETTPYVPILSAEWDEDEHKFRGGVVIPGWRGQIAKLVHSGDLYPSPYLEIICGERLL
jgi:hypothetical protein